MEEINKITLNEGQDIDDQVAQFVTSCMADPKDRHTIYVSYAIYLWLLRDAPFPDGTPWDELIIMFYETIIIPHDNLKGREVCYCQTDALGTDPFYDYEVYED